MSKPVIPKSGIGLSALNKKDSTQKKCNTNDLSLLKRGDPEAYHRLIYDNIGQLTDYLTSILKNPEDAEDICQDVFIYIWENRESLSEVRMLKNYIFSIARHKAFKRKNKLREIVEHKSGDAIEEIYFAESPEQLIEITQTKKIIHKTIEGMPQIRREIYLMKYDKGYSNKEIAQKLSLTSSTVRTHISLALQDIKKALKHD